MSSLPSGLITFLFTDIEGSTKLAQQHPDEISALLARHNEILDRAVEAHAGFVFLVVGDAYCAAFQNAGDALQAALDAQRQFSTQTWLPAPVKVRIGLHTGFAEKYEGGYRGYLTMARVQRVMSCGHGGQILLSHETAEQVRDGLPHGAALRDMGRHHLKGLSQPEHLFQLITDDLPSSFPPLKSTPVAPSQRREVFSLLDQITRGQLIGRENELSQLEGFWNRAERGEGHLVLLSGEPGIGKTRLVEELFAFANLRGALVLEGHFHPELGVTYLGFREALQDYLRSIPADLARAVIGTSAPELVKLVPEVESIIPDIIPNPPMGELEAERLRLFDHITQFLIRLARKTPVLFVLEDLHWADGPSLMFLHFLLRNTRQSPILVLGTYRETELDPVRPFYETLLGMNRDRLYTRVALHGLDELKIGKLVSALLDSPVEAGLVAAIAHDTEGNPFFIEEVVKGLVERDALHRDGGEWKLAEGVDHFIPQSIQIALGKRLDTMSEDARMALSLASILGGEFELDILIGMSGWDEDRMLDALDEAVKAQLIAETRAHGEERYRFAHALLLQVIYQGINTRRRARFHQQAGEALETVHARKLAEQIEALAYHFARSPAGAAEKAVNYGLSAAENAVAVYAHDQAIQHYTEVLEALHDLDDPQTEVHTWELIGDAKMRLYYVREALAAYESALSLLENTNLTESHEYCRLSYKLGELIIREQGDPKRAREYLERALLSPAAALGSPQRAKCLATLAVCLVTEGSLDEAQTHAQNALDLAEELKFPDGIASSCGALCNVFEAKGDISSYVQYTERQIGALDKDGDLYGVFEAYHHAIGLSVLSGDYTRAESLSLEALDLCKKFNAPGWEGTILAGYLVFLQLRGKWDELLVHGERVLPLFDRVGCSSCFLYVFWEMALVEARRGNLERSKELYNSVLDIQIQLSLASTIPAGEMRWKFFGHYLQGEWDRASAVVADYIAARHPGFTLTWGGPAMWAWLAPEAVARAGRWQEARSLAAETLEISLQANFPYSILTSRFALGLAFAGQSAWSEALAEFEHGLEIARMLDHPWDIATFLHEMGSVYAIRANSGDMEKARRSFDEALAYFTELKAQPSVDKVIAALDR